MQLLLLGIITANSEQTSRWNGPFPRHSLPPWTLVDQPVPASLPAASRASLFSTASSGTRVTKVRKKQAKFLPGRAWAAAAAEEAAEEAAVSATSTARSFFHWPSCLAHMAGESRGVARGLRMDGRAGGRDGKGLRACFGGTRKRVLPETVAS